MDSKNLWLRFRLNREEQKKEEELVGKLCRLVLLTGSFLLAIVYVAKL